MNASSSRTFLSPLDPEDTPPPDPDPVDLALFIDRLEFDLLPMGLLGEGLLGMGRLLVLIGFWRLGVGIAVAFRLLLRGAPVIGPDDLAPPLKLLPPEGAAYEPVALVGRGRFVDIPPIPSGGLHLKHFPFVTRPASVRGIILKTFFLKHFRPQVTHSPLFLRMFVSSSADITEPVVLKSLPRFSIRFILTCSFFF
jgi:hypothetical protein